MRSLPLLLKWLCLIRGSRHIAATSGPIHMVVFSLGILGTGMLGLDFESVGPKVVPLGLKQISREILGAVAVVEAQGGTECWSGDTPFGTTRNSVPPSFLRIVNGLVKEAVKEKVFQVRIGAIGLRDVLEKDGADDASSTPHQSN